MSNPLQNTLLSSINIEILKNSTIFLSIMDNMNDGVLIVDLNDIIIYTNNKMCEITDYSSEELLGKEAAKLLSKEHVTTMQEKTQARENRISDSYELSLIKKNKQKAWVRISGSPILNKENKVIGSLGVHTDITERKTQEIALKKALKEKDLLLKEVHHRVKNNMQIISSLMSLQAAKIKSAEDAKLAFLTCQKRIKSIAILHEIIYEFDSLGKINFNAYSKKFIQTLQEGLGLIDLNISVTKKSTVGEMGLDKALTCGMLINELVVNSVEHAFDEKGGNINISAYNKGGNTILVFKDDGVGAPEGFPFINTSSLGHLLISAFVEQLNGTISVENNPGACFKIVFPA